MENATQNQDTAMKTKFCKHCGGKIPEAAVVCTLCGCQVEEVKQAEQPSIVINNSNANTNANMNVNAIGAAFGVRAKNKWVAFILCVLFGYFGVHKFYEGKIGMGFLYFFTGGLFGIGWFVDLITLFLFRTNPYYV